MMKCDDDNTFVTLIHYFQDKYCALKMFRKNYKSNARLQNKLLVSRRSPPLKIIKILIINITSRE